MFNLKAPCKLCPFRSDCEQWRGGLGERRAQEIATSLRNDGFFTCHKTIQPHDDDGEECEKRGLEDGNIYCAGALIMMEKEGIANDNRNIRIAKMLEIYPVLRMDSSVFASCEEFVAWRK